MSRGRQAISEQLGRNLAEARGWARLSQIELAQRASLRQRDADVLRVSVASDDSRVALPMRRRAPTRWSGEI